MDELNDIYDKISFLRGNGMKMKDIAAHLAWQPSVLSALYTTVLPAYKRNREKGMGGNEAINEALVWANNVSKRKLLGSAVEVLAVLENLCSRLSEQKLHAGNPYIDRLRDLMQDAVSHVEQVGGVYFSYSRSSSSGALKVEPYYIGLSADGSYIEVVHHNAYGATHTGFAVMNGMHHLYIVFNELQLPQLSLFNICLKLPLYDCPKMLKGMYLCCDYNYNPVARRILFVRAAEGSERADFDGIRGCLKDKESLTADERAYYDYTCGDDDIICMCCIPSPRMTVDDLQLEKDLLRR